MFALVAMTSANAAVGNAEQGATYENNLEDEDKFNEFKVVNANGDNFQWTYDEDNWEARLRSNTDKTTPKDDWLISPPIYLEAGKEYKLTLDMRVRTTEEVFELKYGTSRTVEAMTETLIEPTVIVNPEGIRFIEFITVETSGDYYFGIHAMSPADRSYIYFQYLGISAPIDVNAPAEVSEIKILPDIDGNGVAEISFKTPEVNVGGNPLTELTKIELLRDNESIHIFESPAVGATMTYTDDFADYEEWGERDPKGKHVWSLLPYNSYGIGKRASETGFIGINIPAPPETVSAVETENIGEVSISWVAADKDIAGNPIRSEKCKYSVYEVSGRTPVEIAKDITELNFTYQALGETDRQDMLKYSVQTTNEGGTSRFSDASRLLAVGKPYDMPYKESFAQGHLESVFGIYVISGNPAGMVMNDEIDLTAQDGDNGFIAVAGENPGDGIELTTGKINLSTERPQLSFYTYNFTDIKDKNTIEIAVIDGDDRYYPALFTIGESSEKEGWALCKADLSAYTGKTVQLGFDCTINSHPYTLIDNISVADAPVEGIESLYGADDNFNITAGRDYISVTAEDSIIAVITTDGKTVYSGHCNGTKTIPLSSGLYLVKAGSATKKILIL